MGDVYNPPKRSNSSSWYPLDVNEFVSTFLRNLQDRNLKAVSETAIGSMIVNTYVSFVIGKGLQAQASPENSTLGWTEEQRTRFINQAESLFRTYAGSRRIDHYGKLNFYQLQSVAFRNCCVDGDSLRHSSYRSKRHGHEPYVQVLSGRWVRNPIGEIDTKTLTGGVYFDGVGREVGYSIAETTDNLSDTYECKRVSKYNPYSGFEEFDLLRLDLHEANQVRGIPILTSVLEDIGDLESFKAAYKAKAATQALFTGVITSEKDAPTPTVSTIDTLRSLREPRENVEALPHQVDDVTLGTGNIISLNPGEKFEMAESKVPATDYEKFINTELSHIAAGAGMGGVASEMVLQKYSDNYSASRATIAGQEKKWDAIRDVFATGFCTPIWKQVIDWGIRKGRIEAPGYLEGDWMFKEAVLAVTWVGSAPISIDPKKEIEAHLLAIGNNLETKEDAVRELYGKDFEETIERIGREKDLEQDVLGEGADITQIQTASDVREEDINEN